MYKILHIPSGLVVDHPSDLNLEEAQKTIKYLCRLHKQYMSIINPMNRRYLREAHKLFEKMSSLHISELEAFFVTEKKQRFQVMHNITRSYYEEFYDHRNQAELALNDALKKQRHFHNKLRAWFIPLLGLPEDDNKIAFDDPKKTYSNRKREFMIVEV